MPDNTNNITNQSVHSYAVRRVNPFRGVMQIIEAEEGRAMTCNGVVWEILVRAMESNVQALPHDSSHDRMYFRFGMWSLNDGLLKRSNSPADDQNYFDLAAKCEAMVGHIETLHQQLPFRLEDNRELWLYDSDDEYPLALLATSRPGIDFTATEPETWSCTISARASRIQHLFPQAAELEYQVGQRAGSGINKHWVRRLDNGDGVMEITEKTITANRFPVLLLEETWNNTEEQQRVSEYIKWISPSLLTLQHLDDVTRSRIEISLNVQAISIEHHWHLYPEVINQKLLKAARIQSRIVQCS